MYYHLGEYDDALSFALGAGALKDNQTKIVDSESDPCSWAEFFTPGELFDVAQKTQFVNTIISKCIDQYAILSS